MGLSRAPKAALRAHARRRKAAARYIDWFFSRVLAPLSLYPRGVSKPSPGVFLSDPKSKVSCNVVRLPTGGLVLYVWEVFPCGYVKLLSAEKVTFPLELPS